MTSELIGGHEGYDVFRVPADPALSCPTETMIVHVAKDELNAASLINEERSLQAMHGTGLAPEWLVTRRDGPYPDSVIEVYESDLGDTDPVYEDGEILRHAVVRLLVAIRSRGLRHGDLSSVNLIMRDGGDWVGAIDWQESHPLTEPAPQKQPWTDSWMLMNFLKGHADIRGIADTPRIARRWQAVLADLGAQRYDDANPLPLQGKHLVDLGCFQGDFTALAAAEGMHAMGFDGGGFRGGENSIEIGWDRWMGQPWGAIGGSMTLHVAELFDVSLPTDQPWEVAMCFSTWAWMVTQRGQQASEDWLRGVIAGSDVLYFETQLAGDGPGAAFHPTDEAVFEMLVRLGGVAVHPVITVPVTGRPASRTVWAVR